MAKLTVEELKEFIRTKNPPGKVGVHEMEFQVGTYKLQDLIRISRELTNEDHGLNININESLEMMGVVMRVTRR